MKIRNQVWLESDTHLILTLRSPFWSAWKRYGWEEGVEGFGISLLAIKKAEQLNKKIRINVIKYGSYEITPKKALDFMGNYFFPRDNKILLVIPRTSFDRIKVDENKKKEYEKKENLRTDKIMESNRLDNILK
jgi:hypothetical protein